MRNLIAVIVVCSLVILVWLHSVGHAQDGPLSKAKLRDRVAAEVVELGRNVPIDAHLRDHSRDINATTKDFLGAIGVGIVAQAFPVDWLIQSEVVWPLAAAGLVPSYVSGVNPVSSPFNNIVIVMRYGIDDRLSPSDLPKDQAEIDHFLNLMKLSGPIFVRKGTDAEPRVLYVRNYSSESKDTTATVVIRCKVREQQTGRVRELVASEEWRFLPTDDKQQRCWKRIDTQHHFCPGDEKREESTPGKAGG